MERGAFERYAIYWAPPAGSALEAAGEAWLGWSAARGESLPAAGGALTGRPRRYGFHATLKPPFRLAEGATEADLDAALRAFAARTPAMPAPPLAVDAGLGFAALRPVAPAPVLDALAAACVREFDGFRRPPDAAERARREAHGLDARGRALLAEWGYPHVLDRFRFHVTLSARLPETGRDALLAQMEAHFAPVLGPDLHVSELSLFGDPGGGQPFRILRRYPLAG